MYKPLLLVCLLLATHGYSANTFAEQRIPPEGLVRSMDLEEVTFASLPAQVKAAVTAYIQDNPYPISIENYPTKYVPTLSPQKAYKYLTGKYLITASLRLNALNTAVSLVLLWDGEIHLVTRRKGERPYAIKAVGDQLLEVYSYHGCCQRGYKIRSWFYNKNGLFNHLITLPERAEHGYFRIGPLDSELSVYRYPNDGLEIVARYMGVGYNCKAKRPLVMRFRVSNGMLTKGSETGSRSSAIGEMFVSLARRNAERDDPIAPLIPWIKQTDHKLCDSAKSIPVEERFDPDQWPL